MRRTLAAIAVAALGTALFAAPAQSAPTYTTQTLHFTVTVAGGQTCSIIGDLYTPASATKAKPVPAILTTNGFGGSKDDQAGLGRAFAELGYVVLSYSGLGFGGSGCKITLDDPAVDGAAASQLVSYLGGKTGIAFTDAQRTVPAPALTVVKKDTKAHNGKALANDPRVGMVGGSYGGQVQYAAASVDPRIDALVPIITWADLSYSLSPNNTSQTTGVSTTTPGAAKLVWALGFSGLGVANGLQNVQVDPSRLVGCPNFANFVCPALLTAGVLGHVDAPTTNELRKRSVSSYVSQVRVPTLIMQGQSDTLFNLNEGVAVYQALKKQGTTTKMLWINGGHSGPNAPGEIEFGSPDPATQYASARAHAWFERYLKDNTKADTGPDFAYFRDWVSYTGNAKPAYGTSSSYPVGTATPFYLSGKALTTDAKGITAGSQTFLTPVAGLPTSADPLDVVSQFLPLHEVDLPGTAASWTTAPLTSKIDVVGSPVLDVTVGSPTAALTQALGPTGQLVLFAKVLDVDPSGKATVIRNLVAPVRVANVNKPFRVTLPAFAHRFDEGHSIRLVLAGGSTNYRGGLTPNTVTIKTGTAGQVLTLPVVP